MSGSPGNPLTIPVNQCLSCNVVMETTKRAISTAVRQKTGRDRQLEKSQELERRKRTVGVIKRVSVKLTVPSEPVLKTTQHQQRLEMSAARPGCTYAPQQLQRRAGLSERLSRPRWFGSPVG